MSIFFKRRLSQSSSDNITAARKKHKSNHHESFGQSTSSDLSSDIHRQEQAHYDANINIQYKTIDHQNKIIKQCYSKLYESYSTVDGLTLSANDLTLEIDDICHSMKNICAYKDRREGTGVNCFTEAQTCFDDLRGLDAEVKNSREALNAIREKMREEYLVEQGLEQLYNTLSKERDADSVSKCTSISDRIKRLRKQRVKFRARERECAQGLQDSYGRRIDKCFKIFSELKRLDPRLGEIIGDDGDTDRESESPNAATSAVGTATCRVR